MTEKTDSFEQKESKAWIEYGKFTVELDYTKKDFLTIAVHETITSPDPATIKDCLFVQEIDLREIHYHD